MAAVKVYEETYCVGGTAPADCSRCCLMQTCQPCLTRHSLFRFILGNRQYSSFLYQLKICRLNKLCNRRFDNCACMQQNRFSDLYVLQHTLPFKVSAASACEQEVLVKHCSQVWSDWHLENSPAHIKIPPSTALLPATRLSHKNIFIHLSI